MWLGNLKWPEDAATRTIIFCCYVFEAKRNCQRAGGNFDVMFAEKEEAKANC
jgi:hypothetical protein